jgi:cytochrome c biogenesis protein CcmG, thiol:disulfide interchange protein DsbE|tara:strand:- start:1234 stop:1773 length:540 start_codon:yes stop_codon:yes gene_type:complete
MDDFSPGDFMRKLLLLVSVFILYTQISWIFADNRLREQEHWEMADIPEFTLPDLYDQSKTVSRSDLAKQDIRIVNFFASWCGPCKVEHPLLMELADQDINIFGIAYRDNPERTKQFLERYGNPFHLTASGKKGDADAEWGFSTIPQTFVIDSQGKVLFHFSGSLYPEIIERSILPLFAK